MTFDPPATTERTSEFGEGYYAGLSEGFSHGWRDGVQAASAAIESTVTEFRMKAAYREGALWAARFIARSGAVPLRKRSFGGDHA